MEVLDTWRCRIYLVFSGLANSNLTSGFRQGLRFEPKTCYVNPLTDSLPP